MKKKILIISSEFPYPPIGGGRVRLFNMIKELSKEHDVYLLYIPYDPLPNEGTEISQKIIDIKSISSLREVILIKDLFRFRKHSPLNVARLYVYMFLRSLDIFPQFMHKTRKMIESLNQKIEKIAYNLNPDIIHIHGLFTSLFVERTSFNKHVLVIIDITDSFSLYYLNMFKNPKRKYISRLTALILSFVYRKYEKLSINRGDYILVVSEKDRKHLKNIWPDKNIILIPNGVDTSYFSPKKVKVREDFPSIVFHGSLRFPPNIDAAKWLVKDIFPLLKHEIKDLKLYLVGMFPHNSLITTINTSPYKEDIILKGNVEDIRQYIRKSSIVVVPMREGTGIKNKILEGMSLKRVVVATPQATGGLSSNVKKAIVIVSTEHEFVQKIVKLIKNLDTRLYLEKEGYKVVRKEYTWDKVLSSYKKLIRQNKECNACNNLN